jgi:cbb3-type cytochrome oxidase subunit 3
MKELYADATVGIIGLLFFFFLFVGILIWLFWPGAKEKFKEHGNIPLRNDSDE